MVDVDGGMNEGLLVFNMPISGAQCMYIHVHEHTHEREYTANLNLCLCIGNTDVYTILQ